MKKYLFLISILFITHGIIAQCVPPVDEPDLECGTGTLLTDGANINTGTIFYSNGGGPYQNVNLNGGTLILCGEVTFSSINYNAGTLIIKEGANVTFNNSYNSGGDHWFYNFGNVTFNVSVFVSGNNTFIHNEEGATITVNGDMVVLNGGLFINNGTANIMNVLLNGGANVCLSDQSVINMNGLTNNHTNSVNVGSGLVCVSYASFFDGNNPITSDPGLRICRLPGAPAPAPAVIGTATVIDECTSCLVVLPVTLEYFTGKVTGTMAYLEWKSSMEENVATYQIEQSVNNGAFTVIGELPAKNTPSLYKHQLNIKETASYRLKITDIDGKYVYSNIIVLKPAITELNMRLKTNPVIGGVAQLEILTMKKEQGQLRVVDVSGTVRLNQPVQLNEGENIIRVNMQGLSAGSYYILYEGTGGKVKPVTVIKN